MFEWIKKKKHNKQLAEEMNRWHKEKEAAQKRALENLFKTNHYIKDIKMVDKTEFYDTKWLIKTVDGNEVKITRREMETISTLCLELKNVHSVFEIKNLDESERIYYD